MPPFVAVHVPFAPLGLVASIPLVLAYLVGALPFGYIVGRLRGVNLFTVGSGNTYTATYNLNAGVSGTGNKKGRPVFRSRPVSGYKHYQLASSSPGYRAASDGKSMGIRPKPRR